MTVSLCDRERSVPAGRGRSTDQPAALPPKISASKSPQRNVNSVVGPSPSITTRPNTDPRIPSAALWHNLRRPTHRNTMSAEKRPASDDPSGQLVVKRQNLGERALARANASGSSALVQSVCS